MVAIPPTLAEDPEDVAWALQTADALWKRNERVDAIVWLRRAAQAAGDAQNDDRALALAREAAELAEWIARNPGAPRISKQPPPPPADSGSRANVDELLRRVQSDDEVTLPDLSVEPPPQRSRPSLSNALRKLADMGDDVPTAAQAHAGMLDPWAQGGESSTRDHEAVVELDSSDAEELDDEEIITSAPVFAVAPPDLSAIEGLGDLPDDVRELFAQQGDVRDLERGDEVSGFALAVVLEGPVEVGAVSVDAPARRLESGAVLRVRGTIERVAPVRLVAAGEKVRVVTWGEPAVAAAFGACPWVEDELREAADLTHALVGVTLGRLGERLDATLRAEITGKLQLRSLAGDEVFVQAGAPIPGFVIVGAGELELSSPAGRQGGAAGKVLGAGDILFPAEVLRAAAAPSTVRAGAAGGALVLMCDRRVTQELLVTCPPLLEILAESS
jgi:hypothetical protein